MLVFGDDTRSFLAIVRSLGRRGVAVHVVAARLVSPALLSRHIAVRHELPAWIDGEAEWLAAVEALLRRERYDLVIPCDETALLPLARHRARLETLARLAVPNDAAIAVLFDKHGTRRLAHQLRVPVPPGRLPRPGDTAEGVAGEFGLPVMAKPRRSFTLEGLARRRAVSRLDSVAAVAAALPTLDPAHDLLEGFVPGAGLGVSILAHRGRVLQGFQHRRVREDSSGSYYRVSAPLEQRYLGAVAVMVAALDYTGLAMFEFRTDAATGAWVLLEVNARPWGSMPLAIHAGVDFPWRWYCLLTCGEEGRHEPYRVGLYGRNLLPDIQAILREARSRPWRAVLRLSELGRLALGRERQDVWSLEDPRPGLREIGQLFGSLSRHLVARVPGLRALMCARARRRAAGALARVRAGAPVLFVCQGNICRSPFAAHAFERLVRGRVEVGSAALVPRGGRGTPALGVEAARAHGIDLSGHGSRVLEREAAEGAALIVIFDHINLGWLRARFPRLETPVVPLGRLVGGAEMSDPVDGDAAAFAASYARIAEGVAVLARLLPGRG